MSSTATVGKHPAKVAAGQAGARKRWGAPRVVRIDDLTPEQRRLVLALIDAARQPASGASDA